LKLPLYLAHFEAEVAPFLLQTPGFRGSRILRHDLPEAVELVVLTFWESLDAVRRFTGDEVERAMVDPRAREILLQVDDRGTNYQIIGNLTP
jgi:heme-degrading monooxygenase HmoA